jgi:hypothetical protein
MDAGTRFAAMGGKILTREFLQTHHSCLFFISTWLQTRLTIHSGLYRRRTGRRHDTRASIAGYR